MYAGFCCSRTVLSVCRSVDAGEFSSSLHNPLRRIVGVNSQPLTSRQTQSADEVYKTHKTDGGEEEEQCVQN